MIFVTYSIMLRLICVLMYMYVSFSTYALNFKSQITKDYSFIMKRNFIMKRTILLKLH